MTTLILGLVLFLGIHSISIFALPLRNSLAAKNEMGWKGFYSIISAVGLIFIFVGYGEARANPVFLYQTPIWFRHLAALLLIPVFALMLAPYFPGKIKAKAKHPQLIGVKLWALSHILINGMLADVVLFGSFLAWAVVNRISMKKRESRAVPGMPESKINDVILVALGLGLYVLFVLFFHQLVTGVRPF